MELWVVGKTYPEEHERLWGFKGVFSSRELAIDACKEATWFVGPATLDEEIPSELASWPDAFYPLAETE